MNSTPVLKPYLKSADIISPHATGPLYYTASQLASIYQFPTPNISINKVVAVVSFGGGLYGSLNATSKVLTNGDVQQYWKYQGILAVNMPKVIVHLVGNSKNNVADYSSTCENTLDVSVIGSCCPSPNLTIILFIFPSNTYSLFTAFKTILEGATIANIKYKPTIISVSWGCPEIAYLINGKDVTGELTNVAALLKTATQNGVNICVASGDAGSTDSTTVLSADFPSSCPYVTAVGGTSLTCNSGKYDINTQETVWNNGVINGSFWATGGGVSQFYSKPSYQTVAPSSFRCVPDIALDSDPNTGIVMYLNGVLQTGIGGTSMAAPMVAGFLACLNLASTIAIPFVNNVLYNSANAKTCFHDIISGNNYNAVNKKEPTSYVATVGYDCASGLGSIIGSTLAIAMIPPKPIIITSVSLNKPNITLRIGASQIFIASVIPTNATNATIKWTSSNINIVSITQTGTIKALVKGIATITASSTDGSNKSTTLIVNVK